MPKKTDKLKQLRDLRASAEAGGGAERVAKIHDSGRLTARERIHLLFDPATFQELGVFVTHRSTDAGIADKKFLGDGVVCGYGSVAGRLTYAFAQDFTVFGGTLSESNAAKICRLMDLAIENGADGIVVSNHGGRQLDQHPLQGARPAFGARQHGE